jgi:hypothetical protein
VKIHLSNFREQPYYRDLEEGTTIVDLADVFYGIPIDDTQGRIDNEDGEMHFGS